MFTIVARLPHNLVTALEPHRQKYDPKAHIIAPHITILESFEFTGSLEPLYHHMTNIGETHAPITVSLVGWDACDQNNYHLFLPLVTGRLEFMTLRENTATGPLNYLNQNKTPYHPQITLGRFVNQDDFKDAKQELREFEAQFSFMVTSLEILYRKKSIEPWQILGRFDLDATILSPPRKKKVVEDNLNLHGIH